MCCDVSFSLRHCVLGIFATIALSVAATAQTPATPRTADNRSANPRGAIVYDTDDVHVGSSRVFIHVYKTGLGHEHGVVGLLKRGRIALDQAQGGGELVFDMQSFDADSDEARRFFGLAGSTEASTRQQVNANMHGAAVLDTQTHRTATFKIKSVTKLAQPSRRGWPQYQLDGDFTLRGATNPVRVIADAEPKGDWLHVRGGFSILQSSYGIQPFKKAFGAVGVADRLDIWGDLWIAQRPIQVPAASR